MFKLQPNLLTGVGQQNLFFQNVLLVKILNLHLGKSFLFKIVKSKLGFVQSGYHTVMLPGM